MTLQASTVATAISQFVVSGLKIKNLSNIPSQVNSRDCPVMIPDINFVSNFVPVPRNLERSNGFWESTRNLNYWIFFCEAGQGRGIFEHVQGMTDLFDRLATKILSTDINGVDVVGITLGGFGVIKEPNGKEYFGFAISISISELINS